MKIVKKRRPALKGQKFGRQRLIILCAVILVAIIGALVVSHNNSANKTKNQTPATTASSKGGQSTQSSNATTPSSDKTQGGGASSSSTTSGVAPKTPYGSFVSNHSAHLNDSELSTCLTSAGAKCQITFSGNGSSKTLDQKTTDGDGAAYWTWKPQDLGLSTGSWQIIVTASQNGQTATTTDTRNLTIQP